MSIMILVIILVVVFGLLSVSRGNSKEPEANLTDEDVKVYIKDGDKIQAIKLYRDIHLCGLNEAKEKVDKMEINIHNKK